MTAAPTPASVAELVEAVRSTPRVLAVGNCTKPRLSAVIAATELAGTLKPAPDLPPSPPLGERVGVRGNAPEILKLSTQRLRGIIEYDPAEFTFTALAGTPVKEIASALAEKGQYLPFDPMWLDAGATLGGTVASGVSGPGRFRFGGLRDFILAVKFIDGQGKLLRMGSKVVKNAAGFDVPKFFVGSLGRFGILTEITFKVFPRPPAVLTMKLAVKDVTTGARVLTEAANSRWEPDALDMSGEFIYLRLAGPSLAINTIADEILRRWPGEKLSPEAAETFWSDVREFRWAHPTGSLVKVPLTPDRIPALNQALRSLKDIRIHYSAGGNVAFVSVPDVEASRLDEQFRSANLTGLTLRGNPASSGLWLGLRPKFKIAAAVKSALDPDIRFPSLDD